MQPHSVGYPQKSKQLNGFASSNSEILLERCDGEGLHYGLRRLGLHDDHLAENLPLARLGRWLPARLDPGQAWDGEHAVALHLLRSDACKALEDLGGLLPLQLALPCDGLCKGTLAHLTLGRLHGSCLHRLHGCHSEYREGM